MNGILFVDKPEGWTSQDVCSKLRGVLKTKRVGHGGTLDPMATGLLPVFVGRATRAAEFSENAVKGYVAGVKFGVTTDTQDITGNVLRERPVNITREDVIAALPRFTGELMQLPPMYSAIKIGGKKLYELARRGESVERQPRRITIHSLSLTEDGRLDVLCSKGTYIRALVNDLGEYLGCGAAMSSLRRTRVGERTLADAHTLQEIIADPESCLLPVDSIFSGCPAVVIGGDKVKRALNGNPFNAEVSDGKYRVYGENGDFLLLGEAKDGQITTIKSFFEV